MSDLLYKELFYQEVYFASYKELNDPLDLSARIEFTTNEPEAVEYLLYFAFRTQFELEETSNFKSLICLFETDQTRSSLKDEILKKIKLYLREDALIFTDDMVNILSSSLKSRNLSFDTQKFKLELERLENKFFRNSLVSCFSKSNNNFLMWSHYASRHSGICLEFNLDKGIFPFEKHHRNYNKENIKGSGRIVQWESKSTIRWSGHLEKIQYKNEQPYLSFYKF